MYYHPPLKMRKMRPKEFTHFTNFKQKFVNLGFISIHSDCQVPITNPDWISERQILDYRKVLY